MSAGNGNASIDDTLNDRGKAPGRGRLKLWLSLVAAAIIVALIVTVNVVTRSRTSTAAVPQSAAKNDTLTVGLKLAPTNLDIRTQSGAALDQALIGNVYEPLVGRSEDNKPEPGLAKSWEVSDDAKSYVFHLYDGITFSNGDKLDAEDVKWSIDQLIQQQYQESALLANVSQVEATDPQTVTIQLKAPYSDLLWVLSGRAGLVLDKDAKYDLKTQAVGSGPFLVKSFSENDSLVLTRNNDYWGENKAKLGTIVLKYFADDNAAVNALKSGDVQVLAPIVANLASSVKSDSRFEVKAGDDTDKFVLAFNGKQPALSDIRVRQAIRYAIDHKQIIASRGGDDAALGGPIPSLDPGYEDLTDLYPHNVDKARELLQQAGYNESNPLKLNLEYANTYGTELGDQLKSQLKEVGIELNVKVVEFSAWLQDVLTNKDYDLSLVDHTESHDFYSWATPDYYYNYDSKEVQDLYAKAVLPPVTTRPPPTWPKPLGRCRRMPPPIGCSTTE